MNGLKLLCKTFVKPMGKARFLHAVPKNGRVLDVGCGNNSPARFKQERPDVYYVGLDVGNYNQTKNPEKVADRYIVTTPEEFDEEIRKFESSFDAVVSSHNLEHCNQPEKVLQAMLRALKPGGRLYLSFPCEASVSFPTRRCTLNFFDDPTHRQVPQYGRVCDTIREAGCVIEFCAPRYRPPVLFVMGAATEPVCALTGAGNSGTWALYGFESVIWASRPN